MNINDVLAKIPAQKAKCAEEAENLRVDWQMKKEALKMLEAKTLLMVKANDPDLKVDEIKASVTTNDKVYESKLSVITSESAFRKKEVAVIGLDDVYNAAKRLAQLKIAEWNFGDSVKEER